MKKRIGILFIISLIFFTGCLKKSESSDNEILQIDQAAMEENLKSVIPDKAAIKQDIINGINNISNPNNEDDQVSTKIMKSPETDNYLFSLSKEKTSISGNNGTVEVQYVYIKDYNTVQTKYTGLIKYVYEYVLADNMYQWIKTDTKIIPHEISTGSIKGYVKCLGTGLDNVKVYAASENNTTNTYFTDANGYFEIDYIYKDTYELYIIAPNCPEKVESNIFVNNDVIDLGIINILPFITNEDCSIYGNIYFDNEHTKPVKDAKITIAYQATQDTELKICETDSNGYYLISGIKAGDYTIKISIESNIQTKNFTITSSDYGSLKKMEDFILLNNVPEITEFLPEYVEDEMIFNTIVSVGQLFSITVIDNDSDNITYDWSSTASNATLEKNNNSCIFTPENIENCSLTVTASDGKGGKAVKTWNISVHEKYLLDLVLEPNVININTGENYYLSNIKSKIVYLYNKEKTVTNLIWSIKDGEGILSNNIFTAPSSHGTTTLSCIYVEDGMGIKSEIKINTGSVFDYITVEPSFIEITHEDIVDLNSQFTLKAHYSDGTETVEIPASWTLMNEIGTLTGSTYTGSTVGSAELEAEFNGKTEIVYVNVNKNIESISLSSKLDDEPITLCKDEVYNLNEIITVTAHYSNGSTYDVIGEWSLSGSGILDYNMYTASEIGTAAFTATYAGNTASINANTVHGVTSIALSSQTIDLAHLKTHDIDNLVSVDANYSDGTTLNNISGVEWKFKSGPGNFDDGIYDAYELGTAVITASYTENFITRTADLNVNIVPSIISIAFEDQQTTNIELNDTLDLNTINIIANYSDHITTSLIDSQDIIWSIVEPGHGTIVNNIYTPSESVAVNLKASYGEFETILKVYIDSEHLVIFNDTNFENRIRTILGKTNGEDIYSSDMETITLLSAYNLNISDITGIEYCTNLTNLILSDNNISDISVLSNVNFPDLTKLYLSGNNISDISVLSNVNFPNLTFLALNKNNIFDINVLSSVDFPNLSFLTFDDNNISDISVLSNVNFPDLTKLYLSGNNISDVTVLSQLTNLTLLSMKNNKIIDISSLTILTDLTELYLSQNNISDISALNNLTNLSILFLEENSISNISALSNLINLNWLNLKYNNITDITFLINNTGISTGDQVDLSGNNIPYHDIYILRQKSIILTYDKSILNIVLSKTNDSFDLNSTYDLNDFTNNLTITAIYSDNSTEIVNQYVTWTVLSGEGQISDNIFTAPTNSGITELQGTYCEYYPFIFTLDNTEQLVMFNDINFENKIREVLGKTNGEEIYKTDMKTITSLTAQNSNISDITGIEHCIYLVGLSLEQNNISDISVLSTLKNLRGLYISSNNISDISVLSSLIDLETIDLTHNNISDISALSNLINLYNLYLNQNNNISDISILSNLTNLRILLIEYNEISDINVLSNLTNLTRLSISGNGNSISDISALSNLTNLNDLFLGNANITNISALSNLTNLNNLYLSYNNISDISALSNLTNLNNLYLSYNNISDISALSNLNNLKSIGLLDNNITDITALINNTGLGTSDYVVLRGNTIPQAQIDALIAKGVNVSY